MHKKIVQDDQIYVSHYKNLNATNVNEAPFFFCSPLSNIYPPVLCLFLPVRSRHRALSVSVILSSVKSNRAEKSSRYPSLRGLLHVTPSEHGSRHHDRHDYKHLVSHRASAELLSETSKQNLKK